MTQAKLRLPFVLEMLQRLWLEHVAEVLQGNRERIHEVLRLSKCVLGRVGPETVRCLQKKEVH